MSGNQVQSACGRAGGVVVDFLDGDRTDVGLGLGVAAQRKEEASKSCAHHVVSPRMNAWCFATVYGVLRTSQLLAILWRLPAMPNIGSSRKGGLVNTSMHSPDNIVISFGLVKSGLVYSVVLSLSPDLCLCATHPSCTSPWPFPSSPVPSHL